MKFLSLVTPFLTLASASPHFGAASIDHWKAPGANDHRGPCPMMNTLANHQFLPHDGRNITRANVIKALAGALNFNSSLGSLMFDMAIKANPQPNATFFTLDHLNRHNVLEHDASLSRTDAYFGSNHIFNETVFEETKSYWTEPILTAQMLANSKVARQVTSRAYNPDYTFSASVEQFSLGELAAPIIAFGDMESGTVNRTLVEYFFVNERFPAELGWSTKKDVVSLEAITRMSQMIANATSLLTPTEPSHELKRRGGHFGLEL